MQPPLATDAATLSHNSDADAITAGAPSGRRNEMYNAAAYTEAAPRVSFVTGEITSLRDHSVERKYETTLVSGN